MASRRTNRRLTSQFDALKQYEGNTLHCPHDSGEEVLVRMLYPHAHKVSIIVRLQGCPYATNGDLTRAAFPFGGDNETGPRLLSELERLTARRRTYRR